MNAVDRGLAEHTTSAVALLEVRPTPSGRCACPARSTGDRLAQAGRQQRRTAAARLPCHTASGPADVRPLIAPAAARLPARHAWACRRQAAHCASCCAAASTPRLGLLQGGRQWDAASQHRKQFAGNVLGYVTPWNAAGYLAAVRFRAKFTWISPVWYQLRTDADQALILVGGGCWGRRLAPRPAAPAAGVVLWQQECCSGSRSGGGREWGGGGGWPAFDDQHPHPAATASRHVSPASPSGPACVLCSVQLLHPGCCTVDVRSPARRRARAQQHLGRRAADTSRRS
jgi:hypothetical protein